MSVVALVDLGNTLVDELHIPWETGSLSTPELAAVVAELGASARHS